MLGTFSLSVLLLFINKLLFVASLIAFSCFSSSMTLFSFCVFFLFASISHAKCVVMSRTARNASPMHLGVMHRFSFTLSTDFTNAHKRALSFVFTLLHRRHLFAVGVVVVFTHIVLSLWVVILFAFTRYSLSFNSRNSPQKYVEIFARYIRH